MAKSVKVIRLLNDLGEDIDGVVSILTQDQINTLVNAKSEVFKLAGLAAKAYNETEPDEDQAKDLARAEKDLEDLASKLTADQNKIRVSYLQKQIKATEKAKPEDHGIILADLDSEKAEEIAKLAVTFDGERDKLRKTIRELSNVKLVAAENAIKELYGFDGSTSNAKHTRPDVAGNAWLVLDLFTKLEKIKSVRGQWYLDKDSVLWFLPVGADWFKNLARPFELKEPEGWNRVCTIPADKLASASYLQAVCHMAQFRIKENESIEDLAAYVTGIIANDNVDQSSTGGSRSVWHVVSEKQDPGYVRQVYGEKLEPYNLPAEPTKEPTN